MFTAQKYKEFERVFQLFDANGDGSITNQETMDIC